MAEKRIVKLKSSVEELFDVDEAVASESLFVKHMIEDVGKELPIPLLNVSSKILSRVIKYCTYHVQNQKASEDKPSRIDDAIRTVWCEDFLKVDQQTLYYLILSRFRSHSHKGPTTPKDLPAAARVEGVVVSVKEDSSSPEAQVGWKRRNQSKSPPSESCCRQVGSSRKAKD